MLMRVRERANEVQIELSGVAGRQESVLAALDAASAASPVLAPLRLQCVFVHAPMACRSACSLRMANNWTFRRFIVACVAP